MIDFLNFAVIYGMTKCMKTMLAGTVFMAGIWGVKRWNRGRILLVDYYALVLLPLALFCGMSKLFYMPYVVQISAKLNEICSGYFGWLYFGVAVVLLLIYAWENMHLHNCVRRLPLYEDRELLERVRTKVCAGDITGLGRWYVGRVRVYETREEVSPFSGGLLHPYVVLPERVSSQWQAQAVEAILCHELLHIRMGHIFWMKVYRLMGCFWWIHPFVYVCENRLHETAEHVCDEYARQISGVSRAWYGQLLIDLACLLKKKAPQKSAAFLKNRDFHVLSQRIGALEKKEISAACRRRVTAGFLTFAVFAAALLVMTSYPRYTRLNELMLFDEDMKLCAYDTQGLRDAVSVHEGKLSVESERFSALIEELDISGEYVYLSFGGIMKVPGVGGGGDTGMISLSDYTDIFYLRADTWENDAMEFLLKYMI